MYKQLTMLLVGMAGLAWLSVGTAAQEKTDKADDMAKEVTQQYAKAMKAEDIEALMKAVEVPFSWDGFAKLVENADELKGRFAKIFAEEDMAQFEYTILEVHPFEKQVGESSQHLDDLHHVRNIWREILAKADRIVGVGIVDRGGKGAIVGGIVFAVRIREGKARVAGFWN